MKTITLLISIVVDMKGFFNRTIKGTSVEVTILDKRFYHYINLTIEHNLTVQHNQVKSTENSWFLPSKTLKMGDLIYVDMEEERSRCWSKFPYNLKKDVLACLPIEYLDRFFVVCNKWNVLFSSTKFITNRWAKEIPKCKPLLIPLTSNYEFPCETYCKKSSQRL